jgi:hypothetical protein
MDLARGCRLFSAGNDTQMSGVNKNKKGGASLHDATNFSSDYAT